MNTVNTHVIREMGDVLAPAWVEADTQAEGWNATRVRFMRTRHWKGIALKVVFTNAIVPPPEPMYLLVEPVAAEAATGLVAEILRHERPYESFVGHASTASALERIFGVSIPLNRGEYIPKFGDLAVVARLKHRPAPGADVEVRQEDLEFLLVWYV